LKKLSLLLLICYTLLFVGCIEVPDTGKSTIAEMEFTEKNQVRLTNSDPNPKLQTSLERKNLVKYLNYWNKDNRQSYLYLLANTGATIGYYNIIGKVTYCGSKLTTREQALGLKTDVGNIPDVYLAVESPGLDGSYGPSEDAIFFFTVENPDVPVVYKGDYLVSGVPLTLSVEPLLIASVTPTRRTKRK
jgi:hypothetical protein